MLQNRMLEHMLMDAGLFRIQCFCIGRRSYCKPRQDTRRDKPSRAEPSRAEPSRDETRRDDVGQNDGDCDDADDAHQKRASP